MSPAELATLTPEQKRERIAVLAGWTEIYQRGNGRTYGTSPLFTGKNWREVEPCEELPNYLRDRNAVAGVLDGLSDEQFMLVHERFCNRAVILHKDENGQFEIVGYLRDQIFPEPVLIVDAILIALC